MSQQTIDVFAKVLRARRSVRGFLPATVDDDTMQAVFELAQTAPSNCNTQPWEVHVASGGVAATLKDTIVAAMNAGQMDMDFPFIAKYEGVHKERQYDAAAQLYGAMGIARSDKAARHEAFMRNFQFFDAPHAAFLFLPESHGVREAADVGIYAQNLMLSLTAYGIASCPQAALSFHASIVREVLGVPETMRLLMGIAFGYEDTSVAANATRVGREKIDKVVKFHG